MNNKKPIIITTINKITEGIDKFRRLPDSYCIIVGDLKSPPEEEFQLEDIEFISYSNQQELDFELIKYLPDNHYCRKNIGYLSAIKRGHKLIAETDDDNIPYKWWERMYGFQENKEYRLIKFPQTVNVYQFFSDLKIWPRGFPLKDLANQENVQSKKVTADNILVWQGLADKNPDVDAIFRLVFPDTEVNFKEDQLPVLLDEGVYCPFNSQNTVWSYKSFPYLYLPLHVRFRFTDILRSYIAQRGIWALNGRIAFGNASVYQDRNYHDLLEDFESELDCYLEAKNIIKILDNCNLSGKPCDDLILMYQRLCTNKIVSEKELDSVQAWVNDLKYLGF